MTANDPRDQLRQADPAIDLDRDPDGPAAQRLLSRIHEFNGQARPHRHRRRTVAAVATAVMAISAGAVASGIFQPNPQDLDAVGDYASEHADVHLPGWRPSLRAETVWCFYDSSTHVNTPVSDFPLNEPLTRDRIATECSNGNDMVRSGEAESPEQMTFCSGTIPDSAYQQRVEERREPVLAGDLTRATPLVPVVLGWKADCDEVELESTPTMSLSELTHSDIDRINRVREVEITLHATAIRDCISRDEAVQTAAQVRQRLEGEWPLIEGPGGDRSVDCYRLWIDEWGLLSLQGLSPRTDSSPPAGFGPREAHGR